MWSKPLHAELFTVSGAQIQFGELFGDGGEDSQAEHDQPLLTGEEVGC